MMPATRTHYANTILEPEEMISSTIKVPQVWQHICYKTYPRFKQIPLKVNFLEKGKDIFSLIRDRETIRDYTKKDIPFKILCRLIYYSCGIKSIKKINKKDIHDSAKVNRFYASGGARYPIELYLIVNRVEGMKKGLYHYNVRDNTFELILERNLTKEETIINPPVNEKMKEQCSAIIILTSVLCRSEMKYLDLAYTLSFEEAGRIGDRLQLLATNEGLGCCPVAGIYHNKLISLLNVDPEEEIPIMAHVLGNLR